MTNQYSNPVDSLSNSYNRLLDSCDSTDKGCLVPRVGPGVYQANPNSRYTTSLRCNFLGKKEICHRFVWYCHHGAMPTNDLSHLCGTANCCNIDHMTDETRQVNISRIGCPGTVTDGYFSVDVCNHTPKCIKTARVSKLCVRRKNRMPSGMQILRKYRK